DVARYRHEHSLEAALHRETLLQEALGSMITEDTPGEEKLLKMAMALQRHVPFDYLAAGPLGFLRIGFDEYQVIGNRELSVISGQREPALEALQAAMPPDHTVAWYNQEDFRRLCRQHPFKQLLAQTFGLESHLVMPLLLAGGEVTAFSFYSRRPDAYQAAHQALLGRLQPLLQAAV